MLMTSSLCRAGVGDAVDDPGRVAVAARVADLHGDELDLRGDADNADAILLRCDGARHVGAVELVVDARVGVADAGPAVSDELDEVPATRS